MKGTISEIWEVVDQVVEENIEKILEDTDENSDTVDNELEEFADLDRETVRYEPEENENVDQDTIGDELIEDDENEEGIGEEIKDLEEQEDSEPLELVENQQEDWLQEVKRMIADYKSEKSFKTKIVETKSSSRTLKTALVVGGGIVILGLTVGGFLVYRNCRKRSIIEALPVTSEPEVKEPILEPIPTQIPREMVPHQERIHRPFFI